MMNARPITAGMIRAAGRSPASSSAELTNLLNTLAESVATVLHEFTAAPVRVEPDGWSIIERETPVSDSATARIESPRGPLSSAFTADGMMAMALCEAAFGGSGTELPFDAADRPLSRTERRLRDALLTALAAQLPEAMGLCFSMRFGKAGDEERKPPSREAVTATFIAGKLLVYVFGYSGEVTLLLPETQVVNLLAHRPSTGAGVEQSQHGHYLRTLQESQIEVIALLPAETIPLGEVAGLRCGQLLKFKADVNTPVLLLAEGRLLHWARMQPDGNSVSMKIIDGSVVS